MQLTVNETRGKAAKPPTKGTTKRTKRAKKIRGGAREGAGRKSLYPGKDTSRHATSYMTEDGWRMLAECQDILLDRCKREEITTVTVSDTIEEAIHRLHKELTRAR
jgi:hypothetical protein